MQKTFFNALILLILSVIIIHLFSTLFGKPEECHWDYKVYYAASKVYTSGGNPYDREAVNEVIPTPGKLPFVYPPATLHLFKYFILLDYLPSAYVFVFLKCLLLAGLIVLWKKVFLKEKLDLLFGLFALLAFHGSIYRDFYTGNISIIEQAVIWTAFYFYLNRKTTLFTLFILLVASFKITPVIFLFLILFGDNQHKYMYFGSALLLFIGIQFIYYISSPVFYANFLSNAVSIDERGIINPSTFAVVRDVVDFVAAFTGIGISSIISLGVFAAVVFVIILITYPHLKSKIHKDDKVLVFLFCVVYALIMPRFKDYSYILLIVPSYYLMKSVRSLYVPLFILLVLLPVPSAILPGYKVIAKFLGYYYPIVAAYVVWYFYLRKAQEIVAGSSVDHRMSID